MNGEFFKERLYAPGPVEVPPAVLEALARPVAHHRSAAFREQFLRTRAALAELLLVPGDDVLLLTGSGTAGFEAALLGSVPAGAEVLALVSGKFGERWAEMARRFGYRVRELAAAPGEEFDPSELERTLREAPALAAVTVVHSETSTGALHDLEALAGLVRRVTPEALLLVDAVTSLGAAELRPREWGLDAVVSGSQKGVMTPPGLAFVWLSERAWRSTDLPPGYYLDLRRERGKQRDGQAAYTPAVSLVAGLEVALGLLLEQGVEAVWRRRARLNDALLDAGRALGLTPLAHRPSPAVAALLTPEGVAAPALVAALGRRGVIVGGGQDELKGRLIRPSLLGWADRYDAVALAAALEDALLEVSAGTAAAGRFARGAAVAAALGSLDSAGPSPEAAHGR